MKTLRTIVVCNVIVLLLGTVACHRSYYRRQADVDAARLIQEKSLDPHWSIPGYTIEVDPASRMFDPFSLDHPPMPPDDPSAAEFMREVDGKPGFPHWHANGDTPNVDNPEWRYMLPVDEEGVLVIDLDTAVELALLHSPDYQRELEDLYLSALAVSLERFDFESQFFLPFGSSFETRSNLEKTQNSAGFLTKTRDTDFGINTGSGGVSLRKAGITGSTLIVNLANSIVWQLSGTDNTVGLGTLSAELTQPLLRAAGRDVVLESLTDAERGLLYNVRELERYRRGYMLQIVAGINAGGGVSVGSGTIGSVSGVSTGAGGALGLLQEQQAIRIQESNIEEQRILLEQFKEYFEFQRVDLLQLKQFQNNVYRSQRDLLTSQVGYLNGLDDFKILLGFPPDLKIEIQDPILDQFVLLDDKISDRKSQVKDLRTTASNVFLVISNAASKSIEDMKRAKDDIVENGWFVFKNPKVDTSWRELDLTMDQIIRDEDKELDDDVSLRENIQLVRDLLKLIGPIYDKIIEIDFPQTEQDIERLRNSLDRRRRRLQDLEERYFNESRSQSEIPVVEPEVLDSKLLDDLVPNRLIEYQGGVRKNKQGKIQKILGVQKSIAQAIEKLQNLLNCWELILANDGRLTKADLGIDAVKSLIADESEASIQEVLDTRSATIRRFISEPGPEVLTEISNLIIDVSLIQALARVDSLTLPIVDIRWEDALEIARSNRRDWMNARAQLVDQWRNIELVADTLESQLDLTFRGELGNTLNNPLKLRDADGLMRIGLQFDSPITRLNERNNYRSALITYQRTKRQYYQFEDEISAQLREVIRQLELAKLSFEISRFQVKNSVDEVQLASYDLVRPPRPGSGSTQVGFQVAQNLIRALNNLLTTQNQLIRNWVQFEILRRQLDFHMGTMRLDDRGIWVDPQEITIDSIKGIQSGEFVPGVDTLPDNNNLRNNADSETAPMDNLPPVSRRPERNLFSGQTIDRSLRPTPAEVNPVSPTSFESGIAANPTARSSNALTNRISSRSLYSNFDSDLRRAEARPLTTSIRRPGSTLARLPAGKKIIDRQVEPTDVRESNMRERIRNRPRIAPFPFK